MIIPRGKRAEIVKPPQQLTAKNGFLANPCQHGNTVNQFHEKLPLLFKSVLSGRQSVSKSSIPYLPD